MAKIKSILSGSLKQFLIITFILIEFAGIGYGLIRYQSEATRIKAHHKKHNISNESLQIRLKQNQQDTIFQFTIFTIALSIAGAFSIVIYQKQVRNLQKNINDFAEVLAKAIKKRESMILDENLNYAEFRKISQMVNDVLSDIYYKENYNYLTKLPKKQSFLKSSLEVLKNTQAPVIVAYIHLKDYGHLLTNKSFDIADKVIVKLARRLEDLSSITYGSVPAKISGNGDFLFSFPCTNYPEACYNLMSKKLIECFGEKIDLEEYGIYEQSISIGFGVLNEENSQDILDDVYKAAILSALQGTAFSSYTDELKTQIDIQAKLETDLKVAIEHELLKVFYQAKIGANDGMVKGAEALVRWIRYGKFENTEKFIRLAEQSDLILKLERLVISKVFNDQKDLQNMGIFMPISINISARHLASDDFVATLEENSKKFNISPKYIDIEIIEREKIGSGHSIENLNKIKSLGYGISLDDFGKDYSSLSYINNLPINSIKIDKSFVDGLLYDDKVSQDSSKAIISGMIKIAKSINKRIIAEGVETIEQVNYLTEMGCDELQGFYYHKGAVPIDEFLEVYEDRLVKNES